MQQQQQQHVADIHPARLGKETNHDDEDTTFMDEGKRKVVVVADDSPGEQSKLKIGSLALNAVLLLVILVLVWRGATMQSGYRALLRKAREVKFSECEVDMDLLRAHVKDNGQEVCSRSVTYRPAAWERDFVANMSTYQCSANDYAVGALKGVCPALCKRVKLYAPLVNEWVRGVKDQSAEQLRTVQPGTWSSFAITTSCPGGSLQTVEAPIEPLVSYLRHPLSLCLDGNRKHVLDKDYMLIGVPSSISTGRRFLFDIGASQYLSGFGGASQSWFVERYKTVLGVEFDRIFAWEYGGNQAERLGETPFDVLTKTSYFVIPASGEPNNCHNPWNFIREICKPEDFVVVKLDMDTPEVETALVEQLLGDQKLARLIDDFYFEDHASKSPMEYHGWGLGPKNHDLARSIQIFAQLRQMGIRAHSWV